MDEHPLELLLRPCWPTSIADGADPPGDGTPRVVCSSGEGADRWIEADGLRVYVRPGEPALSQGETIASFRLDGGRELRALADPSQGISAVPFSLGQAYRSFISESWREGSSNRRLSERNLSLFYRAKPLIPRRAQLAARRRMIRAQGVPDFPAWPLDTSVSRLLAFYAACALRAAGRSEGEFVWFWPGGQRAAVILTHDVENDDGVRLALELADVEQEHGFRSSFNFGAWYTKPDAGVVRELSDRGFEVGMHGLTHDRQLFASRAAFEERLPALSALAERLGAVGFRSPATHRVFDWLAELPVEYDCTISNSDPYEPQPGGCCSVWPFFIGDVVELPYTLPQDHTLLTLLGHRSPALWLEQAAAVEREYGLIQCVSHPDPGYLGDRDKRAVYAEFLRGLGERGGLWRALPRDVAFWWRQRAAVPLTDAHVRRGVVRTDEHASLATFQAPE